MLRLESYYKLKHIKESSLKTRCVGFDLQATISCVVILADSRKMGYGLQMLPEKRL